MDDSELVSSHDDSSEDAQRREELSDVFVSQQTNILVRKSITEPSKMKKECIELLLNPGSFVPDVSYQFDISPLKDHLPLLNEFSSSPSDGSIQNFKDTLDNILLGMTSQVLKQCGIQITLVNELSKTNKIVKVTYPPSLKTPMSSPETQK
jgi:hypothetical protein